MKKKGSCMRNAISALCTKSPPPPLPIATGELTRLAALDRQSVRRFEDTTRTPAHACSSPVFRRLCRASHVGRASPSTMQLGDGSRRRGSAFPAWSVIVESGRTGSGHSGSSRWVRGRRRKKDRFWPVLAVIAVLTTRDPPRGRSARS